MSLIKKITTVLLVSIAFVACGLDENETYNQKYVHVMQDELSSITVNAKAKTVGEYNVYLSSAMYTGNVEVTYSILVGDGLKEGVDFEYITKGTKLIFMSGIFEMPIRILWLPHTGLDPTKDNTLKIVLVSCDRDYSVGFPGPSHNQSVFTITKKLQ